MKLKVIILICIILHCKAYPELGKKANTDKDCSNQFGKEECLGELGGYTCAKLNGEYVINETLCAFCKTYGDSEAIVYHIGEKRTCKELAVGVSIEFDPECSWIAKNALGKQRGHCSAEQNATKYYCARYLTVRAPKINPEETKCEFCAKYGRVLAFIFQIFYVGDQKCNITDENPINIK